MNIKRIVSSCLLGVLLSSSVLVERASAQVEIIFGNNDRHEWRDRERERLIFIRREREERERREWRRREHGRPDWRGRDERREWHERRGRDERHEWRGGDERREWHERRRDYNR